MHPADIKAALAKRGSSQAKIAAAAKVSRAHVSYVIQGRSKSRRVAELISQVTGISIDRLWPGKYIFTDHRIAA
jgi:lambda repressor-like predicted transcriptional regulator